jgi:tetratricopeptide (TPR) repeat protein
VYFFLNYEDERSQRVYEKPYQDFMASYKSGGKHDVKGRFVEHFVTKARQPGVATFEQFEARWRAWIHDLNAVYFGGPEKANLLIERGRKQVADKAYESAEESYEWALRKRPGDPVASFELAELFAAQKRTDAAIYRYRGAVSSLRAMDDPSEVLPGGKDLTGRDLLEISEKALARLDKGLFDALQKADADFAAAVVEAARAYADQELPRASLRLLDEARAMYGGASALTGLREEIAKTSGVDLRRWRRLPVDKEILAWDGDEGWAGSEGQLVGKSDSPDFCSWRGELPSRYTFEATIDASGLEPESGFVAMTFGGNDRGLQFVGVSSRGTAQYGALEKGWKPSGPLPSVKKDQMGSITVRIEVHPDRVEYFLGGRSAGKPKELDPEKLQGRVGFVVQGGQVTVRDARICY